MPNITRAPKTRRINYRKAARLKAGLTEKRAAQLAGVALSTFKYYESGGPVPYHRALPLSQAFGCHIEIFLPRGNYVESPGHR